MGHEQDDYTDPVWGVSKDGNPIVAAWLTPITETPERVREAREYLAKKEVVQGPYFCQLEPGRTVKISEAAANDYWMIMGE